MYKKIVISLLILLSVHQIFGQNDKPQRLTDSINTFSHEYWPTITANDSMLIFNRLIDLNGYKNEDFYYSTKDSLGNWTKAKAWQELNTTENEGASTLSADGRFMIFTSCNNRNSYGSCDLYYSLKIGNKWLPARNLGSSINTRYWETQPSLSADGTELYFVSNRPNGKGKMDIWHSNLLGFEEDGTLKWSAPTNLNINTPNNDLSPFIHSDNETLYFSSDGYSEQPQLDIFISRKIDSLFSTPKNIGSPINTEASELGFVVNSAGTTAYFVSDKETKNRDIYSFPLPQEFRPKEVQILEGKILNKKDKKPLFANISLQAQNDTNLNYHTLTNIENGEYLLCLKKGEKWHISVQAEGYLFYSELLNENPETKYKNIELTPIEKGATLRLKNIFFDTDKATLKEQSKLELQTIQQLLQQNSSLKIEIAGHTDNQGSTAYNQQLSEARAKAVQDWLISHGIATERLKAKGYGELQPIANNDTAKERAKNRRTELRVISY
ncbi:MAG: OmpA family protein [Flavobacteriaceae bacterium]|nr:OmpA family protein [Flavobacteriaceae bacterium]